MALLLRTLLATASLCMAQSELRQSQGATNYLVIGNPGVGKSTVLNGLYKSHWGDGTEMFSSLNGFVGFVQAGDNRYIEVPGLEDNVMREQAAEIIPQALQQDGSHKVIFVITLENGVRPEDLTTIKVVLEAADIQSYGILVNKVSPAAMGPNLQVFERILMEDLPVKTEHILFFAATQESLAVLPEDLLDWIEMVPSSLIPKESVNNVNSEYFDALSNIYSLTQALAEERSKPQQIIENQQKLQEELEAYRAQLATMRVSGSQSHVSSTRADALAGKDLDADQAQQDLDLSMQESEMQQSEENQQKFQEELDAHDTQHDALHGSGNESPPPLPSQSDLGDSNVDLSLAGAEEHTGVVASMLESPLVHFGSAAVALGLVPLLVPGEADAFRPAF